MFQLGHFGKSEFIVLCRVSFCSCVVFWSVLDWASRLLGQGNPPLAIYLMFFLSFFALFFFSERALRHFFLIIDSSLLSNVVSKVRAILPFNNKFVLSMLMIHYICVESQFTNWDLGFNSDYGIDYTIAHVYLLTSVFTISLVRSFIVIPSLVLCSVVIESPIVRTFLKSGRIDQLGQIRKSSGSAGEAFYMAAKGNGPAAAALLIGPVIASATGIVALSGDQNLTTVPARANEVLKQTSDYHEKLRNEGQKLTVEREHLEKQRDANLTDIKNQKNPYGSDTSLVQKEVEKARIDKKVEVNGARAQLVEEQEEEAVELVKEFTVVKQASENGNCMERGFAEIASKSVGRSGEIGDKGRILTAFEVYKAESKLVDLQVNHLNAQAALSKLGKQVVLERGGVGSTFKVPSILEPFFF